MDRYTKQEKAGQGTYGVVYKSLDKKDNKFVALKVTQPQTHQEYARGLKTGDGVHGWAWGRNPLAIVYCELLYAVLYL